MLFGVARPLSPPVPLVKLTALSLAGAGGGRGLRPPAAGLLAGGAGGVGFALMAGAGFGAPLILIRGLMAGLLMFGVVRGAGAAAGGGGGGGGGAGRDCGTTISST